jgi:hypothetical protein
VTIPARKSPGFSCVPAEGGGKDIIGATQFAGIAPMSKHRIKFKLPFFGEAEAEGLAGILAFVIVVVVAVVALHWPG